MCCTEQVPEKELLEQIWAGILEMNGQVNERDPDIQSWNNEARFRKILKKAKSWSATGPDGIVTGGKCFLRRDMHCIW